MDFKNIKFQVDEGVATITLDRPEFYNAINVPMAEELSRALELCNDSQIRAVIITGSGKAFCSGGDLKVMQEGVKTKQLDKVIGDITKVLHRAITDLRILPRPVIAAINGPAAGAGMSLALACDLRIASDTAKFRQAYTANGLVPDGGWTVFVPLLVGLGKASELVFTDPVIDAQEALQMGLVSKVVPPEELLVVAQEWGQKLAAGATFAFAQAKMLLNSFLLPTLETQLEKERQAMIAAGKSEDSREGILAFLEKRTPQFKGR
ncbi:enoyl-CoA hydratase/isomerase family protein [Calderihabitans maritimus]|uniref:Enoyl-CoA hydratase/carnithine racemase n=1 Tax=Calderihabitans maritimus TaxID=1246530 RepID=A0A1Z5HU94_9FIRM|nr:enoyl-CoA hydratase-related protein [Calderihabitans maritimus]GAW92978.1 enoyl-CoA hydratase/carnithine racemase [Calderihabitans maritimus]